MYTMEKEMAAHSSILAWKIPWTEESGAPQFMGLQKLDMTEQLNHHHHHVYECMFVHTRSWSMPLLNALNAWNFITKQQQNTHPW